MAQVVAGLLVAGGGLPAAAASASAAPEAAVSSAVGKPSKDSEKDSKVSKKDIKAAADGSTAASSYGVFANVSLLGAVGIGTGQTPKSDWPAGPAQATTAKVAVTGLLSTGAVTTTAEGDDLKDTAKATSSVAGLGTGTGLQGLQAVTADVIGSSCLGDAGGVTATTTVTGLKLNGVLNTSVPANPAPNTVIDILGLGKLHLNEQTRTTTGGKTRLATNALRLQLLGGALSAVGQGDVIVGHTECLTTDAVTPTAGSLTPTSGPANGGTEVRITGSGFRGATGVRFGAKTAGFTIDSPTQITAIAPDGTGSVNVQVITPAGTGTASGQYTYVAAPAVTGVSPATGPPGGGTTVTISGSGFSSGSTVKFGTADATGVTVNSPTSITATAPAGTGSQFVTVTNSGGTSAQTNDAVFSYVGVPTVGSITPGRGPVAGGTAVSLSGTNFTNASVVLVDGTPVPTTYDSSTGLSFVTPQHAAGTATITVRTGSGGGAVAGTGSATFTYGSPTVSNLAPGNGSILGGTSVTVTGTNLDQVTSVDVGNAAGTITAQSNDGTSLTFTTPANLSVGTVTVTLNGPGSTTTNAGPFAYQLAGLPPIAVTMNPSTGPIAGGTPVTITSLNLVGTPIGVDFGGVPGTNFSWDGLTISVTSPQTTNPGDVGVAIRYSGGVTQSIVANTFTYTAAAASVGSLSPSAGPATGGTTVTVTGSGFTPSSIVFVDGMPVVTTFVNSTTVRFTSPLHAAGAAPITVRTGGVTSNAVNFTYAAVPLNVVALPLTGPTTGGTAVTLSGLGLGDVDSLVIGGNTVNAGSFTSQSSSQIVFATPAHAAGIVTVTLQGDFGTSLLPSLFVYAAAAPSITSVTPSSGPLQGGFDATLTGTGFDSTLAVLVGGLPATNISVNGAGTSATFRVPAGLVAGATSILVTTTGGTDTVPFTYTAFDGQITGISPLTGPTTGGTQVTITGTDFAGATGVEFGGTPGTSFNVNGPGTQITVNTPAKAAGVVSVVITSPSGNSTSTSLFTYLPVNLGPTVTTMSPAVGPVAGGTQVAVYGTGFLGATGVTFGGTAGTNLTVLNSTTLLVDAPAHAAGVVDVIVTTLVGSSTANDGSKFTYVAANSVPVVDSMTPRSGPTVGGTTILFRGLGLQGVDRVTFDGQAATDLNVVDDTTLSVRTPAHPAGGVAVVLRNANGSSRSYLFTYVPLSGLPTVSSLTPNVGPAAGGTEVTIIGTGFDQNTTVSFDGAEGTDLELGPDVDDPATGLDTARSAGSLKQATRDKDMRVRAFRPALAEKAVGEWKAAASNMLRVTTPAHPGGPTTVTVTNSAGSISFVQSFTFIPVLAATATINTNVALGASKRVTPQGPSYSGIEVTSCSTPDGLGSVRIADDGRACVYRAADRVGTDRFVMSVIDDLNQVSQQTVNVTVVAEGGGGTGGGGGNDTGGGGGNSDGGDGDGGGTGGGGGNDSGEGDGDGTGGSGGNDTGGGLAFTGTPLLLVPGLVLGLVLVLIGTGLLGAERFRIRRGGSYRQPTTDEDGRQLMPAGLFGPDPVSRPEPGQDSDKSSPDDAA
ncbi:choice-of-anchor P family protein [Kineosporia sp. NBRC 101677]|uniref:beta strand repeat-containing protein n=1 Tax=Kineosporia sp. NBRC 101677 TaxID=3032197 RepID=UPI0025522371|nr:choice-of-anchor P family protein [Kineosporia sp. NBRC 101677]